MATLDPVEQALVRDAATLSAQPAGPIAQMADRYTPDAKDQFLGFLLGLSYDDATIVTCDGWKRSCGGVPKNSFVLIKLSPAAAAGQVAGKALILARVVEAVPTPLDAEQRQTIFNIHKVQAELDPYTNQELQWGALKASVLGTYYDAEAEIDFGSDIDSYVSPHFYEVYVPLATDLERLVNNFVAENNVPIGQLRYTETLTHSRPAVSIGVAPPDFVSNRTALFGKTRMGKSNTIKVIGDMMLRSGLNVGQIIFDLAGEYAYRNEQDNTSLYDLHQERCVRYSLRDLRQQLGAAAPRMLKVNFYEQVSLGFQIITQLWDEIQHSRPNYLQAFLNWDPCNPDEVNERFPEYGDRTRYQRAQSMYFAMLHKAGFAAPRGLQVQLHLNQAIRQALATAMNVAEVGEHQSLPQAIQVYEQLYQLSRVNRALFAANQGGPPYLDPIHESLLAMIGDNTRSGFRYVIPFGQYHDTAGGDLRAEILHHIDAGRTVIIDLANANEVIAGFYSQLVARAVLNHQVEKFASGRMGEHSVLFYFEEAHNLFRRDDKDLTSIYNRLAKEGAKFHIGMVYATQSMTTLSPDLLKNTENFFIAHLNDDREITELERRYEFKDIGLDVQRCKTRGYVRLITLSHRYALPVQIQRFGAPSAPASRN